MDYERVATESLGRGVGYYKGMKESALAALHRTLSALDPQAALNRLDELLNKRTGKV